MDNIDIGVRALVPHLDGVQGIITAVHFMGGLLNAERNDSVTLRYVDDIGGVIDDTFSLAAVDAANPPPVDVDALRREIESLTATVFDRDNELHRLRAEYREFKLGAVVRAKRQTAARRKRR